MLAERVAVPKMCQKLIRIQTLRQRVHPAKCLQIHIFGVARKQPEQPLQATQAGHAEVCARAWQMVRQDSTEPANMVREPEVICVKSCQIMAAVSTKDLISSHTR